MQPKGYGALVQCETRGSQTSNTGKVWETQNKKDMQKQQWYDVWLRNQQALVLANFAITVLCVKL